jgi:hypothetical protein
MLSLSAQDRGRPHKGTARILLGQVSFSYNPEERLYLLLGPRRPRAPAPGPSPASRSPTPPPAPCRTSGGEGWRWSAGWEVREGVLAAPGRAQAPGGPPEDAERRPRRIPGPRHRLRLRLGIGISAGIGHLPCHQDVSKRLVLRHRSGTGGARRILRGADPGAARQSLDLEPHLRPRLVRFRPFREASAPWTEPVRALTDAVRARAPKVRAWTDEGAGWTDSFAVWTLPVPHRALKVRALTNTVPIWI